MESSLGSSATRLASLLLVVLTLVFSIAHAEVIYYHTDALGTPVVATNEQGQVIWRESYTPHGTKLLNQAAAQTETRGFTGHVHDKVTGLTYMGARWYDPELGRFMGIDPKGFRQDDIHSFNPYVYANNNPYKYIDPDGEAATLIVPLVAIIGGFTLFTHSNFANGPVPGQATVTHTTADHLVVVGSAIPAGRLGSTAKTVFSVSGTQGSSSGMSSRAQRREAMRQAGIPTSQQPKSQSSPRGPGNKPAGRELVFETPEGEIRAQHQLQDRNHGAHWEIGKAKPGGQVDPAGRPRLQNDKIRVE